MHFSNRITTGILTGFLILMILSPAAAMDVELTGMLRSYSGARLQEGDIPVAEQTVDVNLRGWGDMTQINVNPFVYVGADGDPEIGIREAYIDLFLPSLDLRVGKQAVVWGEAEGVFITDIVSPQDMRSFILADFREVRMGIPAVRADYYTGAFTFETVWIPRFVPSRLPDSDSIWFTDEMSALNNAEPPADGLENSEIFGKVSYFGSALNSGVMAGYAWDDQPVRTEAGNFGYERYTVVGGSFSTTLSSVVLRSEAAAYLDRAFTYEPPQAADEHHQLHGLVGLDWSLFGVDMSTQYIGEYVVDHDEAMAADEFGHTATFRLRDSCLSDTLDLELFGYLGIDPWDALLRPSLTYGLEDGVEFETGAEIFLGDEEGKFGRYSHNTMLYASLRWYF
ncbi:DUF1302 family protein [Marispirochaeta sp.]|uniref:DUF1302 family protein n=1 Tax=Marispirochaeta sp. TaxID=2038653 RepID=UPI0029C6ABD0|nr:DUF1302 family protein [Marispirochaeta sp.]